MPDRVSVFIDYENAHRVGHGLFAPFGTPVHATVLDPTKLGKRLVARRHSVSELVGIHAFRGRPLPQFQPEACSANDLLADAWQADGTHVIRRDLKYEFDSDGSWRAREKGIDVALAIAVIAGALKGEFDVAVVFSNDTDQLPTLELAFHDLAPRVEIACWSSAKPLWFPDLLRESPPRRLPFCHFLNEADFLECRDLRATH